MQHKYQKFSPVLIRLVSISMYVGPFSFNLWSSTSYKIAFNVSTSIMIYRMRYANYTEFCEQIFIQSTYHVAI